jgi:hypothetical protein
MAQCIAKSKRSGERCKANAVDGYTVCRMHGAGSPHKGRPGGAPITTGRYSIKRQELARKAQEFANDTAPGDLTGELVLMRALLQDYLDRFEDGTRLPFDDIGRIFGMVEAIGRLVERIAKILAATALTQNEVQQFKQAFLAELPKYVPDPDKRLEFIATIAAALGFNVEPPPRGYIDVETSRR